MEGQDVNVIGLNLPEKYFFDNHFNSPNYSNRKGKKYFDLTLSLQSSSFVGIRFNNEFGIPLAFASHDSISIKAQRTIQSNYTYYELSFSGSNAIAHNIYYRKFYPAGKNLGFFEDLPKKSKTYSEYYVKSKKYIDSLTFIWDSLRQNNAVSEEVYQLYKAEIKGILYNEAIKKLTKVNPSDSSWKNYTKWLNIKQVMFYQGGANNPILLKTYTGAFLYQSYLRYILKEDDAVEDTLLKSSDLGYYYYYDTTYREEAWGRMLWELTEMFPTSASESDLHDLEVFKKYYPHSFYFNKVNHFQDSIIAERKAIPEPINIDTKKYKKMKSIFNSIDGRYFFIDVWATWCGPCVQEFNNFTSLSKFLLRKSVKEVFLSINEPQDSTIWRNFINDQHLSGYHFMLSNSVQKELLHTLSKGHEESALFIPRYLMYDKQEDKYHIDLPRPSSGDVLESVIEDILDKKRE